MRTIPATNNQRALATRYPGGTDIPNKIKMIINEPIINIIIPIAITNFLII